MKMSPRGESESNSKTRVASKSSLGFDNCVSAVDGLFIRTNKPSKHVLADAGLGLN